MGGKEINQNSAKMGGNVIMAANSSRREIKELKETCGVETTLNIWYEIGEEK